MTKISEPMRTFMQAPKVPRQPSPTRARMFAGANFGQSRAVSSLPHPERTRNNQAPQRFLQSTADLHNAILTAPSSPHPRHGSNTLPVSPPEAGAIQAKLAVNKPADEYEQEAERITEQVIRMPEPQLQAACACGGARLGSQTRAPCREEECLQTKRLEVSGPREMTALPRVHDVLAAPGGQPLDSGTQGFMESRFGHDFSEVRVHTDANAAQAADLLGAQAFTYGSDIYFNRGEYNTATAAGKRLLAHELTHVIQQRAAGAKSRIQRQCSDPNFCKPYATRKEIAEARAYLLTYLVPALEAYFGSEVGRLWRLFLARKPGASLAPRVYNRRGNSIYDSFSNNNYIHDETDHVLDLVASRLSRGYGNVTQPISNFLSKAEMKLRTNFANPFTIPGNIAGAISSSAAGRDSREITWGRVSFDITRLPFGKKLVNIKVILGFQVKDAIDFCPGGCGSILEKKLATVKLSRLEASGEAYDVPFIVRFTGPRKNKRVID